MYYNTYTYILQTAYRRPADKIVRALLTKNRNDFLRPFLHCDWFAIGVSIVIYIGEHVAQ